MNKVEYSLNTPRVSSAAFKKVGGQMMNTNDLSMH